MGRGLAALLLAVAVAGPALALGHAPPRDDKTKAEQYSAADGVGHDAARAAIAQIGAVKNSKPDKPQSDCTRLEQKNNSELCAQWYAAGIARETAKWALWTLVLGGAAFLLSIGGLFALIATIRQGREANRISRANSEEQLRAWVSVEIKEAIGFKIVNGSPHFGARVRAHNLGPTPARAVSIMMSMAFGDRVQEDIDATIAAFKAGEIEYQDTMLFPGEDFVHRYSCEHDGERPGVVAVHVYVLAAYQPVFDDELRFTARIFRVIDLRRGDDLIDFATYPYGDKIHLRPNEKFIGYAT